MLAEIADYRRYLDQLAERLPDEPCERRFARALPDERRRFVEDARMLRFPADLPNHSRYLNSRGERRIRQRCGHAQHAADVRMKYNAMVKCTFVESMRRTYFR